MFTDELWANGGAHTTSYVTVNEDGSDRYLPECLQHKYSRAPAWMFHGTIVNGRKDPALFCTLSSAPCRAILKYNTVPLPPPSPDRSPPDSSNSLLQSSPEVSCKFRKVLQSKREIVLQWWY